MNTDPGNFDSQVQPTPNWDSPFGMVGSEATDPLSESGRVAMARQDSPFSTASDDSSPPLEPGRPARLPERRKQDSPFQLADPAEGYGFESAAPVWSAASFAAPSAPVSAPSAFARSAVSSVPQAFGGDSAFAASRPVTAFENWNAEPAVQSAPAAAPSFSGFVPSSFAPAPSQPVAAFSQAPAAGPEEASVVMVPQVNASVPAQSDSFSIRQLELRAIFGVDREMGRDEILQRSRALPGIRNLAFLKPQDVGVVEAFRNLLPGLGFGSGGELKIYSGSVPLEFIREGAVTLVAQTDGGFAPGVRETLMIVARELGRIS